MENDEYLSHIAKKIKGEIEDEEILIIYNYTEFTIMYNFVFTETIGDNPQPRSD